MDDMIKVINAEVIETREVRFNKELIDAFCRTGRYKSEALKQYGIDLSEKEGARMKTFDGMIARPKEIGGMMINGGKDGYIHLHPNQKWKVSFNDDKDKVELENRFLTIYLPKEDFKKYFAVSFERAE